MPLFKGTSGTVVKKCKKSEHPCGLPEREVIDNPRTALRLYGVNKKGVPAALSSSMPISKSKPEQSNVKVKVNVRANQRQGQGQFYKKHFGYQSTDTSGISQQTLRVSDDKYFGCQTTNTSGVRRQTLRVSVNKSKTEVLFETTQMSRMKRVR